MRMKRGNMITTKENKLNGGEIASEVDDANDGVHTWYLGAGCGGESRGLEIPKRQRKEKKKQKHDEQSKIDEEMIWFANATRVLTAIFIDAGAETVRLPINYVSTVAPPIVKN